MVGLPNRLVLIPFTLGHPSPRLSGMVTTTMGNDQIPAARAASVMSVGGLHPAPVPYLDGVAPPSVRRDLSKVTAGPCMSSVGSKWERPFRCGEIFSVFFLKFIAGHP